MDKLRSRIVGLLLAALLLAASLGAGEDSAVLAGRWLQRQLDNGLAADAVATFRSLPPAVRARLEEGGAPDLRLELAAAHLLTGDSKGAAELSGKVLAGKVPLVPESSNLWIKNARLFQGLIARWLHPSPDDPFELLAEAAGREEAAGVIFQMLLGRVAEQEGYPALAEYSFDSVASRMKPGSIGESKRSQPLPGSEAAVRARAAFWERIAPVDRPGGRPAFWRAEPVIELFMIDRAGKRAFGIWYEGPPEGPKGGQIRLEESEGVWKSEIVSSWIA